jgi:hypothetical protein
MRNFKQFDSRWITNMLNVLKGLITFVSAVGALTYSAFGQCATSYSDGSATDDASTIYGWSVLTDNYTDGGSGCAPTGWGSFLHTYTVHTQLVSPTGRTNDGWGYNSQYSGSGQGYDRADSSLAVLNESGDFTDYGRV